MDSFQCNKCGRSLPLTDVSRDEHTLLSGRILCTPCASAWKQECAEAIRSIETPFLAEKQERKREQEIELNRIHLGIPLRLHGVIAHWSSNWQRCMQAFLETIFERSESRGSVAVYASLLANFFDGKFPEDVTHRDVDLFLRRPLKNGAQASAATKNRYASILSSFYKFASGFWITGPDSRDVPLFQSPSPTLGYRSLPTTVQPKSFTDAELRTFFAAIPTVDEDGFPDVRGLRNKAILATLFYTARRKSEIMGLRWGQIQPATFPDGNGGKRQGFVYRWKGKGHVSIDDEAELPLVCKQFIDDYLLASGRLPTIESDDPIFMALPLANGGGPPIDPHKPLSGNTIWRALKHYARNAGLDYKRLTVHGLRHSSVQQRWIAGEHDLLVHQKLLRHKNAATTSRYLQQLCTPEDPSVHLLLDRFSDL